MIATIGSYEFNYTDTGEGPPVLCVHGFPLSSTLWEPLVEALQDDYRVIVPDLRGYGQNEPDMELSMRRFAEDLAALLDELDVTEPVVMVGLSMGGYILFEMVRRFPERVRALVLVDTRPQADDEKGKQGRAQTAQRVLDEGSHVVADDMVNKLFASQTGDALRQRWYGIMNAVDPESVAGALHAMAQRPDSTPTLAEIDVPTLIVVGKEDVITPPSDARAMADAIEGAELVTVPNAGHMTPVEQPDAFNQAVREFLDRVTVEE